MALLRAACLFSSQIDLWKNKMREFSIGCGSVSEDEVIDERIEIHISISGKSCVLLRQSLFVISE